MSAGIRYGLVDVSIPFACGISDQAEAVKAVSLEDGGRVIRVLFKSTEELMPDGAIHPDGQLPVLTCEISEKRAEVRFVKR